MTPNRPVFAVSVGHAAAARIAADVLQAGGNAIDAGVAASIALAVLHSEQVQLGGVAPMLIHIAAENRTWAVEAAGRWPAAANPEFFSQHHGGRVPQGVLRHVVPAAPHGWITALARFGTMGFASLAEPARDLAATGFAAHDDLVFCTTRFERLYRQYPENTRLWLPGNAPLKPGQHFVQSDLATTLDRLIQADRRGAAHGDRLAGLSAVTELFYRGEIADQMVRHVADHGGWLTASDLAGHQTPVSPATRAAALGGEVLTCGAWSQGPALSQMLQILDQAHRADPAPGPPDPHRVLEAMKLALADREAFYGDPDFVDVPLATLLDPDYAAMQAARIDPKRATARLPAPGLPRQGGGAGPLSLDDAAAADTSVATIIDAQGNNFAATPSDMSFDAPAVPGLGFVISTRGAQSYVAPGHTARLAAGKRPRVSACPFLFRTEDGRYIAGGGPGADFQLQAALQVLAGHLIGGQSLEEAVLAPRVFTQSAPTSSEPHLVLPGQVLAEDGLPDDIIDTLTTKGHKVTRGAPKGISNPSLCIVYQTADGSPAAIGDPRRGSGQIVGTAPRA